MAARIPPDDDAPALPGRRPMHRHSMSHSLFGSLLLLIATLVTLLVCLEPSNDPPRGYGREPTRVADGFQQLAEARAWAEGVAARVPEHHRRPLVSLPAYAIFWWSGVSLTSAAGLSWLGTLGLLWVLARLLRTRFGPELAILGAFMLALHPAWHAVARDAPVMPWTGFWLLLILAAAGGRGWLATASAWAVLAVTATWLEPFLWVLAPGLMVELAVRLWRQGARHGPHVGLAALGALALVAGGVGWLLHDAGVLERAGLGSARPWELEARTGFLAAVPFLVPLAWVGTLMFWTHVVPRYGAPRSRERVLHLGTWGALATFAFLDTCTIADVVILLPALVAVAMSTLHTALRVLELRRLPLGSVRGIAFLGVGLPATALLLDQLQQALETSQVAGATFAVVTAGLFTLAAFMLPVRRYFTLPRVLLPVCFLLLPLPLLGRLLPMVEEGDDSLARAGRSIAVIVPPAARLGGDYAHALSMQSHLPAGVSEDGFASGEQLRSAVEEGGYTHLVISQPADPQAFAAVLAASQLDVQWIETFHVRGERVLLLRVGRRAPPPTRFEAAMLALGENRLGDAQTLLLDLLEVAPGCGPAWTRLAQVCARFGDHENAYQAYMRAVEYDPTRVQALVSLANIYQRQGLLSEALMHLRLALHAEPANDALRAEVERLTRALEDR